MRRLGVAGQVHYLDDEGQGWDINPTGTGKGHAHQRAINWPCVNTWLTLKLCGKMTHIIITIRKYYSEQAWHTWPCMPSWLQMACDGTKQPQGQGTVVPRAGTYYLPWHQTRALTVDSEADKFISSGLRRSDSDSTTGHGADENKYNDIVKNIIMSDLDHNPVDLQNSSLRWRCWPCIIVMDCIIGLNGKHCFLLCPRLLNLCECTILWWWSSRRQILRENLPVEIILSNSLMT